MYPSSHCSGTNNYCCVTSRWFLDSVFRPKCAVEPEGGSCAELLGKRGGGGGGEEEELCQLDGGKGCPLPVSPPHGFHSER